VTKIGEVKSWNDERGFGFLRVDGYDIFCHASALPRGTTKLQVGVHVGFEVGINERTGKPMATNVRRIVANQLPVYSRPRPPDRRGVCRRGFTLGACHQ